MYRFWPMAGDGRSVSTAGCPCSHAQPAAHVFAIEARTSFHTYTATVVTNFVKLCPTDSGVTKGRQAEGTWVHAHPRRSWKLAFSLASGGFAPGPPPGLCSWTPLGTSVPRPPLLSPVTNSWLRPCPPNSPKPPIFRIGGI